MEFSVTVDIRAAPERVWAVISDVERWPEWTPSVRSIRRVGAGPLATGARAWVRQPWLPPTLWRVTSLDEGRGFDWVARGLCVSVTARHRVDPVGDGSRATLSVRFAGMMGPLVARLTRNLSRRYLDLEAAGLKRRSEGV